MIETIQRAFNSIRLVNIIHRLVLLAATDRAEYTSLLDRIEQRIDHYENVTYFEKMEQNI